MINPKTDKVCVTMPLRLKTAETTDTESRITSDKILIFKNCTYINQREKSCSLNHLCTDKAGCRRNERTDRGESETMGNGVKWLRWKN